MELKVVSLKETKVEKEKESLIPSFVSVLESKGTLVIVHEKELSSFMPGERWELKRLEGQKAIKMFTEGDKAVLNHE